MKQPLTLTVSTKQECFDTVVRHLFTLPRRAHDGNQCVYREGGQATSEMRCVAGAVIPDDQYDPRMEGQNIDTLLPDEHPLAGLLMELQHVHDLDKTWKAAGPINKVEAILALHPMARHHYLSAAVLDEMNP